MAFQNRPSAQLVYGLVDDSGSRATVRFHIPYATLAGVAIAGADVLRPLLDTIGGCSVVSQGVTYSQFNDSSPAPLAGSRVENKGVFSFRTANAGISKIEIPGVLDSILLKSGAIDRTNVDVAAFVSYLIATNALWCSADGADLTGLIAAYQRSNSSTGNQLPHDR
jgi:hypothetical protein